jgi:hypothetical protein
VRRTDNYILAYFRYFETKSSVKNWIAYFPFIQHGLQRKQRLQQFFVATGTSLLSCYLATNRGLHRHTHRLSFHKTQTAQKIMCPTILLLLCIHCHMNVFTKPFPSTEWRDTFNWPTSL